MNICDHGKTPDSAFIKLNRFIKNLYFRIKLPIQIKLMKCSIIVAVDDGIPVCAGNDVYDINKKIDSTKHKNIKYYQIPYHKGL